MAEDILLASGYKLPRKAQSLVFHDVGLAQVREVITPLDILEHSVRKGSESLGRWGIIIEPLVVTLCPSDQAGGRLEFPYGSMRTFNDPKMPAVAGHEFIGRIAGGTKTSLNQLSEKSKIPLENLLSGDVIVTGDINVGCGSCYSCDVGGPPLYCANDLTFAGIGGSRQSVGWVKEQTGRIHLPGAYSQGFLVLPSSNVHVVKGFSPRDIGELAVFGNCDAVACAKTSLDSMGFEDYEELRPNGTPQVLIIGAGRLGSWHAAVIRDRFPEAKIYLSDTKEENLNLVGDLFQIPASNRYLVDASSSSPYSGDSIDKSFGKGIYFDFIVDASGQLRDGEIITSIMIEILEKGGVFCTTDHRGIENINPGHGVLILESKKFVNGLSPKNNFPYAVSFLTRNYMKFKGLMGEIPGGLSNPDMAEIVATGGSGYKRNATGVTFYSRLR